MHARVVYMCCVLHAVRVCAYVGSDGVSVLACVHAWLVAWLSIIQYKLLPPFLNISLSSHFK